MTKLARSPITLCGSISHHPAPLGAAMHNAGYKALGLDFTYVPFGVTDLKGAIAGMRALGIRGFGVSMPFKREVMQYLDAIEPLAARIGAVNTVVNDDGRLTGYNADAEGAAAALTEVTPIKGKRVLIIGAGGAARAVAHALHDRGARLHVINRDRAAAQALAQAIDATAGDLSELEQPLPYDILVHCTAVGMADSPGVLVPESALRSDLVVMDIVYKPVHTALLAAAQRLGAPTVHGGRMLLNQAFRQFELYTGHKAPRAAMAAALEARIGSPPT
jgi:shikimate dehydrogenase